MAEITLKNPFGRGPGSAPRVVPAEMRLSEDRVLASLCRDSFFEFVRTMWDAVVPDPPVWNWHVPLLCKVLQRRAELVFAGKPRETDLVVNISPGTTKSLIFSVMFPAWTWTRMPHARHICMSYSFPLAVDLGRKSRDVVLSGTYRRLFPEIQIRDDQNAKHYFQNTRGGMRYATGVGGTVTGMHGHFITIDDPLNPKQAASDLELKEANEYLTETVPTRKTSKDVSLTTLVMQRLRQGDPTDLFLERSALSERRGRGPTVFHVRLPAEVTPENAGDVSPPHLVKYYVGGLMDPVRLSRRVLEEYQLDGDYAYAGQFLQRPVPPGGGMFKTARLQKLRAADLPARYLKRVRFWDKAGTKGGGAFTVGVLMGLCAGGRFYVLDVVRGQWDSWDREKKIKETAARDGAAVLVGFEQSGGEGGKQSAEESVRNLRGYRCRVWKVSAADGDKEFRAGPFSTQVNGGNVGVPEFAPWLKEYVDEMVHFPYSRYKDQVDASSGAFHFLATPGKRIGTVR